MIVVISAAAAAEMEAIGDRIAIDSPVRALSFVAELRAKCQALAKMPEAFPVVPRYNSLNIRRCVHGNYLIFYTIRNDSVVVLHVLHGAMDYHAILFPGG